MANRITISLDKETLDALDRLGGRTSENQSELVRQAIQFYETNVEVAENNDADKLWRYSRALSGQDHVLLDRDFLHLFLRSIPTDDERFETDVEQIAAYHVPEYAEDFESAIELLEWLSFCGFLNYKRIDNNQVQLIFHNEDLKDVMGAFIVSVLDGLGYGPDVVKTGITKLVLEIPSLEPK